MRLLFWPRCCGGLPLSDPKVKLSAGADVRVFVPFFRHVIVLVAHDEHTREGEQRRDMHLAGSVQFRTVYVNICHVTAPNLERLWLVYASPV